MEIQPNFNFNQFDIKLETETIGRNFLYFNEIDSTNSVLKDKSNKNVNGTVVFAEKQKAGKVDSIIYGRARKDKILLYQSS